MNSLRLVLGDQLSLGLSSLRDADKATDLILMCEVRAEATYVRHHQKKIAFLFSAMRHFAEELRHDGYRVRYIDFNDANNKGSFKAQVADTISKVAFDRLVVTHPGEYRVLEDMKSWELAFGLPVEIRSDDRFLASPTQFKDWAEGRKSLRMEFFYREMRKAYGILMREGEPEGGQWNFDAENRRPPKQGLEIPETFKTPPDAITREVLDLVAEEFGDHFGDLEPFHYAVTRTQALQALDQFIEQRLPQFGTFQDAMLQKEPWMFHAHIGLYLNAGLLLPMECIQAAERAYTSGLAPLNAVEGFIRQILGWREYVRGIYWMEMPEYAERNYLDAKRPLPDFYWTGQTQMACLRTCILETKANAYAHHIQRLMVLGNFALLAGLAPKEVNEWYLIVYADAFEWVELPNVSGMVLFADGGYLASKPYAAGGAYINKMSDYCKSCRYKVTKKNGPDACPFNYLYWDFLARNREKLGKNHRLAMVYKTYDRFETDKKQAIEEDSRRFLETIERDNRDA